MFTYLHHVYLFAPSVSDCRVAKHVSNGLFIIVAAFSDEEIKLNGIAVNIVYNSKWGDWIAIGVRISFCVGVW